MPKIKKQGNAQIPREFLKEEGPEQDAKYSIVMLSNQQMLEKLNGEWEKYKTEVTNQHTREMIKSTDLMQGTTIKAYNNNKNKIVNKEEYTKE